MRAAYPKCHIMCTFGEHGMGRGGGKYIPMSCVDMGWEEEEENMSHSSLSHVSFGEHGMEGEEENTYPKCQFLRHLVNIGWEEEEENMSRSSLSHVISIRHST